MSEQTTTKGIETISGNKSQTWLLDPALYLDNYLIASDFIFAGIGIPMNLCVIGIIVGFRRLRSQRNFSWLGIGFSNIFVLAAHFIEGLTAYLSSPLASQLCAWLLDLALPFLLLNYFVSLLERYLCLTHSNWYKLRVTNRLILGAQMGSFFIICLTMKGRHLIFGALPFQWHMSASDIDVMSTFILAGFILCLIAQATVWTVQHHQHSAAGPVARISFQQVIIYRKGETSSNSIIVSNEEEQPKKETINSSDDQQQHPFVRIGQDRVSRLDVEASRTITISFVTLLMATTPAVVMLIIMTACVHYNLPEASADCTRIVVFIYYLREFILAHCSIASPVIFVCRSRDIRTALRDRGIQCLA